MTAQQHTPTPYQVEDDTDILDRNGNFVATAHLPDSFVGTAEEYANAAFIVRACNAHDALVAALEACLEMFPSDPPRETFVRMRATINHVQAALKLARGES